MKAAVIAFTGRGSRLAERLREILTAEGWEAEAWIPEKYAAPELLERGCKINKERLHQWTGQRLTDERTRALIYVGACGIAVRAVAPFLGHKSEDPAVIAVDELGIYAVPLLSGHMGGANRLAARIAGVLGGRAVITTATDINGLFAVDEFAGRNGLSVSDWNLAKAWAARLLDGERLGFYSDFPCGDLPAGLYPAEREPADILVSVFAPPAGKKVLHLIPGNVILGIGCRKGTTAETIRRRFKAMMEETGLEPASVAGLASIDLKEKEQGIIRFADELGVPFDTYDSSQLGQAEGAFTASGFVQEVTGVDNVCERAAVCGAADWMKRSGDKENLLKTGEVRLLVRKYAGNGVTLAAACGEWRLHFD